MRASPLEALAELGVAGEVGGDDLQRDGAAEVELQRAITTPIRRVPITASMRQPPRTSPGRSSGTAALSCTEVAGESTTRGRPSRSLRRAPGA